MTNNIDISSGTINGRPPTFGDSAQIKVLQKIEEDEQEKKEIEEKIESGEIKGRRIKTSESTTYFACCPFCGCDGESESSEHEAAKSIVEECGKHLVCKNCYRPIFYLTF